ncbi:MAG: hypothetical protein DLM53_10990 [Candidatus Eremiobacter antarcticus]|nr:MAG: hypothetical protein DLM53_10990 [Candidatus Eremiobacter sp. RRmetagenome_bin22]
MARTDPTRPTPHIAKVSHTLDAGLAERLEEFAFMQRISESSVIEFALRTFFRKGDDAQLGGLLRRNGAGRRRRHPSASGR